jgi:hypothetical protein
LAVFISGRDPAENVTSYPTRQTHDAGVLGATHAAKNRIVLLHAMADDPAAAMRTLRGEGLDGAFKRIERMLLTVHRHRECAVVIVVANFAPLHD